jgi:hypothetical protein
LLPYVYALWLKISQVSWASARAFSTVLTTMVGLLLYGQVCHQTRRWLAGLSSVVLFAASTSVFAFFPIVKTYSLATLFLFSAYVILSRSSLESHVWRVAVAGVLLALAVDTRSYLILCVPLFLFWIVRNAAKHAGRRPTLSFLGGFAIGLAPSLYFFLSAPDVFVFDNVGIHAIRSEAGLIGMWGEKLLVLPMLFLSGTESNGIQNAILFAVSLGFAPAARRRELSSRFAFQVALVLALISILPTPAYPQYFCICIPFLLCSAVCAVNDWIRASPSRRSSFLAIGGSVLLAGLYLGSAAPDLRRYLVTGDGLPGVRWALDREDWRLGRIIEVSEAVREITTPGEVVASFWPGYLFQTPLEPFAGLENDFGLPFADKLTAEQRTKYHIVSRAQIEAGFAAHLPRVVVLGNQNRFMQEVMKDSAKDSLLSHGYALARSVGGASVFVCRSKP